MDDDEDAIRHTGRVIKILDRARHRILGIFRANPAGGGRLVPVDKKALGRELTIPPHATGDAEDGELVAADVAKQGRYGLPVARVKERLGSLKNERAVSLIAVHAHGIPNVFAAETLAEAEAARPADLSGGREDWRDIPLVTIDPADAKDHDDAVYAEPDRDANNRGGHVVLVAIADVAYYVTPGSALDREALDRGNSVYFPDRVVPMLPERISNDLCSLKPKADRAARAIGARAFTLGSDISTRDRDGIHKTFSGLMKILYPQGEAAKTEIEEILRFEPPPLQSCRRSPARTTCRSRSSWAAAALR